MHVLHPTTTFPQHADDHWGPFVQQLCEAIAGNEVTVEVLAANTPDSRPMELDCAVSRFDYFLGKRFQTLMTPPGLLPNLMHRPWRAIQLPFFYRALARQIRDRSRTVDVVHAHWLIPTGFAAIRNTDRPVVATVWGAEYHVNSSGMLGRLVRQVQDKADHLVAVSEYLKQRGINRFNADPDTISVIPNAVDTSLFRPNVETRFREKHEISADVPLVVTVRRLVSEKRVEDVVRAAARVREEQEDVVFAVVGDGPERARLERLAGKEDVGDAIVFTGYRPHTEIPEILSAADLFVMTSEQEGMATALLEAMAAGTPVIATDGVGNNEVITSETGVLYDAADVPALASNIEALVADTGRRKRLAQAARERVETLYSYEVVAEQYLELYKRLC